MGNNDFLPGEEFHQFFILLGHHTIPSLVCQHLKQTKNIHEFIGPAEELELLIFKDVNDKFSSKKVRRITSLSLLFQTGI